MGLQIADADRRAGCNGIASRINGLQFKAIRLAAKIGHDIRQKYPEMAAEYRSGRTAPQLAAKYGFDDRYGTNRRTAISAVRNALCGYFGSFFEPYDGLIGDKSEQQQLALAHNRQTGMEASARKVGIHSLTREQKAEAGRKGGLIRGPLSYRLRIGCHAMPPEVLREHLRRIAPRGRKAGGLASVLAKGLVPYASASDGRMAEIEFVSYLTTDPQYMGPVRANFKKISEKVNEVFHSGKPYYTRVSLKIALQRYRRKGTEGDTTVDPEILFAERLSCHPVYQIPARINAAKIARKVNEEYHGGRPVRNSLSISGAIRRYRRYKKLDLIESTHCE
jgi:hypothetical protein